MKTKHRLLSLVLIAALIGPLMASAETLPRGIRALPGHAAAPFEVIDMDGNQFKLEQAEGRWLMLHFWASWCGPCRKEMPALQRLTDSLSDSDPIVVLVNTAEDEDTIFEFLAAYAPDLGSYQDPDGELTEVWKPRGLPATYLIDPQGLVRYQALGGLAWDVAPYREFLANLSLTEPVVAN